MDAAAIAQPQGAVVPPAVAPAADHAAAVQVPSAPRWPDQTSVGRTSVAMGPQLKIRRAQRQDFERVRSLLGASIPAPRAERKRFRHLVSTLREDLYLAERTDDATLVGLAVIAYPRGLGPPTAVVRQLHGASEAAALLIDRARARAEARGCTRLELHLEAGDVAATPAFVSALNREGWTEGPRTLVRSVPR